MTRHRILTAALVASVLCGCSGAADRTEAPPPRETPSSSPRATTPVAMSRTEAFTVALAAVAPTRDGWTGAATGTVDGVAICADGPDIENLDEGTYIQTQSIEREQESAIVEDLERVRAVSVPVPEEQREALVDGVHGLLDCDGTTSKDITFAVTSTEDDGVEVVTVVKRLTQAKPSTAYRVFAVAVADGLVLACVADGTSESTTTAAADDCLASGRDAIRVIRTGLPPTGSIASAAVLAGRLRPTEGTTVAADPTVSAVPCYGEELTAPTTGVVATMLDTGEPGSVPARVLVQPFDDPMAARAALTPYRDLTADCTGEVVLYEATASTPEYRVTRTSGEETTTGDGGVRFASFFGTAEKRQGTSQVTEVFALGSHLVFVSGEGADDDEAATLADAAVADVLGSS